MKYRNEDAREEFGCATTIGQELAKTGSRLRDISGIISVSAVVIAFSGFGLPTLAYAQGADVPAETVRWTVSSPPAGKVKSGQRVVLTLRGEVQKGWHVYGLRQLPTGPTPLKVGLDANEVATAAGPATGSPAIRFHDPSFNLQTEYYEKPFTVAVPVQIGVRAPAGRRVVPVSVRFQTCNGSICQPPKTVRLDASVDVQAGA